LSRDDIRTGSVVRYPYLWSRQAEGGETEGRKLRPTTVGFRIPKAGGDVLLLFPVTTREPEPGRFAVEVPDIEKRRGGLETDRRCWIILDEFNEDVIGSSFYLLPDPPLGRFSKAFLLPVLRRFIAEREGKRRVRRGD
jgi:hypothetical protein